jgi:hypothetical protein
MTTDNAHRSVLLIGNRLGCLPGGDGLFPVLDGERLQLAHLIERAKDCGVGPVGLLHRDAADATEDEERVER